MELLIAIVSLLCGVFGSNIAGPLLRSFNPGLLMNTLSGLIGGGFGGSVMVMLGAAAKAEAAVEAAGGVEIGAMLGFAAAGAIGGIIAMLLVGFVREVLYS